MFFGRVEEVRLRASYVPFKIGKLQKPLRNCVDFWGSQTITLAMLRGMLV
jgi:hypothetical protein